MASGIGTDPFFQYTFFNANQIASVVNSSYQIDGTGSGEIVGLNQKYGNYTQYALNNAGEDSRYLYGVRPDGTREYLAIVSTPSTVVGIFRTNITALDNPTNFTLQSIDGDRVVFSNVPIAPGPITFTAPAGDYSAAAVCFVTGTRIRTDRGEVAVEDLQVGDLAVTASGAQHPIRWIGHRLVEVAHYRDPQDVWPVRVQAGALAMGVPVRDLLVSPDHCLVFDDVLVPAKHLINGATIRQEPVEAVGYWHIELDSHEALLAEGAPAESYRDCGMHAFFEGAEGWGMRVGDKAPVALLAPHALSGPRLHGVKAILIARAKHLGARRQDDPSLQVVADGQVLTPVAIENRRFTFDVPAGTQELVLRSRSSVPAHWIAENEDRRTLGVRVSELCVDGTAVAMTDEALSQGWNAAEPNGQERWTDGEAHLPACRQLSFAADWFLGYPAETASEPMPVNVSESFAAPVLRLVANG